MPDLAEGTPVPGDLDDLWKWGLGPREAREVRAVMQMQTVVDAAWQIANDLLRVPEPRAWHGREDDYGDNTQMRTFDCPAAPAQMKLFLLQPPILPGLPTPEPMPPVELELRAIRDAAAGEEQKTLSDSWVVCRYSERTNFVQNVQRITILIAIFCVTEGLNKCVDGSGQV